MKVRSLRTTAQKLRSVFVFICIDLRASYALKYKARVLDFVRDILWVAAGKLQMMRQIQP